jgi:uncharacterized membrane protein
VNRLGEPEHRSIDRDRDTLEFGRILALSDGIFAIAMTLLVISITVPAGLSTGEFTEAIADLLPRFLIMGVSILVVASAWLAHHRLFANLQRADGGLIALNIAALGLIAFVPFPHHVLGTYPHEPLALVLYAAVLAAANGLSLGMDIYVRRRGLLRTGQPEAVHRRELIRGLAATGGFLVSMPLAFVLGALTVVLWVLLLPLDRLIVHLVQADVEGEVAQAPVAARDDGPARAEEVPSPRAEVAERQTRPT